MVLGRLRNRLLARLFTAFPGLAARWSRRLAPDPGAIPWALPRRPLRAACLALVTTGGVHLTSQEPFDMGDPDGDPTFREVPLDTPRGRLTITHDYYDHRDADQDLNLVLPAARLGEWVENGCLGRLYPVALGFMGHIDGPHLRTLTEKTAPQAAKLLRRAGADYALLVPA